MFNPNTIPWALIRPYTIRSSQRAANGMSAGHQLAVGRLGAGGVAQEAEPVHQRPAVHRQPQVAEPRLRRGRGRRQRGGRHGRLLPAVARAAHKSLHWGWHWQMLIKYFQPEVFFESIALLGGA